MKTLREHEIELIADRLRSSEYEPNGMRSHVPAARVNEIAELLWEYGERFDPHVRTVGVLACTHCRPTLEWIRRRGWRLDDLETWLRDFACAGAPS